MEAGGRGIFPLMCLVLVLVLSQVLVALSESLEAFGEQKNYYSPDPHVVSPPSRTTRSRHSHRTPSINCSPPSRSTDPGCPPCGGHGTPTPSHGGGGHGTPSPSHGGGSGGGGYYNSPPPLDPNTPPSRTVTPITPTPPSPTVIPITPTPTTPFGPTTPVTPIVSRTPPPLPPFFPVDPNSPPFSPGIIPGGHGTPSPSQGCRCHDTPSPSHGGGSGSGSGGYYNSPPPLVPNTPPSPTLTPITPTPPSPTITPITPTPTTPFGPTTPLTPIVSTTPPPSPPFFPVDPNSPPFSPGIIPGTPIYWNTNPGFVWGIFGYWATIGGLFGPATVTPFGRNLSVQEALSNTRADGIGELYRQGTAALLNSMVNKKFPLSTQQVRRGFASAIASEKTAANQAKLFKLANEGRLKKQH